MSNVTHGCSPMLCNFIEIALRHAYSPVNFMHIFRTPFSKNISEGLPLFTKYKTYLPYIIILSLYILILSCKEIRLSFKEIRLSVNILDLIIILSFKE